MSSSRNQKSKLSKRQPASITNKPSTNSTVASLQNRLALSTLKEEAVKIPQHSARPKELPPLAKPLSHLSFPFKEEEDKKELTSAHRNNKAIIGPSDGKRFTHFFKHCKRQVLWDNAATIAEAEAAIGAIFKFLAPRNVPTTRVYYDDKTYEFAGITSKAIPNFKSNFEDPLQEQDLVVKFTSESIIEKETESQRKMLILGISELINCLSSYAENRSSYIPGVNTFKSVFNYYRPQPDTSIKLKEYLITYRDLHNDVKFTDKKILELLDNLKARFKYVMEKLNDAEHALELALLKKIIDTTDLAYRLEVQKTVPLSSVPYLELLSEKAFQEKIDLDADPDRIISIEENNKNFSIAAKYLKNFITKKKHVQNLLYNLHLKNPDMHNRNFSKYGMTFDFDMAQLPFLFSFREGKIWDTILRTPDENMFKITAHDLLHFPNIKDANFYYWAATQRITSSPSLSSNNFRPEDTALFQSLENDPITIYFKYLGSLLFALTNKETYYNIYTLHLRPHATFVDRRENHTKRGKVKRLAEEMSLDDTERGKQVIDVMIHLEQFQDVIQIVGPALLRDIEKHFTAYKNKVDKKIAKIKALNEISECPVDETPFQRLADSINIPEIKSRCEQIFNDARIAKEVAQQVAAKTNNHTVGFRRSV